MLFPIFCSLIFNHLVRLQENKKVCFKITTNYFCFVGSYTHLLRMLVAEFTLSENPANTTTSQLRIICHADGSVILGTWLQETDHRTIEDQVILHLFLFAKLLSVSHFSSGK